MTDGERGVYGRDTGVLSKNRVRVIDKPSERSGEMDEEAMMTITVSRGAALEVERWLQDEVYEEWANYPNSERYKALKAMHAAIKQAERESSAPQRESGETR